MEKPPTNNTNPEDLTQKTIPTVGDVVSFAEYLKGVLTSMGNNDYEFPQINSVVEGVRSGQISTEEGMKRLQAIFDTKQLR